MRRHYQGRGQLQHPAHPFAEEALHEFGAAVAQPSVRVVEHQYRLETLGRDDLEDLREGVCLVDKGCSGLQLGLVRDLAGHLASHPPPAESTAGLTSPRDHRRPGRQVCFDASRGRAGESGDREQQVVGQVGGRVDRLGWHGSQRHEERRHAFGQRAEHVGDDAGLAGAARSDQRDWLSAPHGGVEPSLRLAWPSQFVERHVQRAQVVAGWAALEDIPICQQMQRKSHRSCVYRRCKSSTNAREVSTSALAADGSAVALPAASGPRIPASSE